MKENEIVLYADKLEDAMSILSSDEFKELMQIIVNYKKTGNVPQNMSKIMKLAFLPFKQAMDINQEKYEKKCQQNRENINKRWNNEEDTNDTNTNADVDNNNINKTIAKKNNDNSNKNNETNDLKESDSCVDGFQKVINFYEANIGLLSPYVLEMLQDYAKSMPNDLIIYAMKKATEANVRTFKYIKGILDNWRKKGIKTLIQAKEETEKFKNRGVPKEETEEEKKARKVEELNDAELKEMKNPSSNNNIKTNKNETLLDESSEIEEIKQKCKLNEFNEEDKLLLEKVIDELIKKDSLKIGSVTVNHLKIMDQLKKINKSVLIHILNILANAKGEIKDKIAYLIPCLYSSLGEVYVNELTTYERKMVQEKNKENLLNNRNNGTNWNNFYVNLPNNATRQTNDENKNNYSFTDNSSDKSGKIDWNSFYVNLRNACHSEQNNTTQKK